MIVRVDDIFNVSYGNSYELKNMNNTSKDINFISRTSKNNGVVAKVQKTDEEPFKVGLITVSLGGSVLETFLQDNPFYTAFHIYVLEPKEKMTNIEKLFYCAAIRLNQYRYNYGRQANRTLSSLRIPIFKKDSRYINAAQETFKKMDKAVGNF
jgi:hypothetical protein